MINKTNLKIAFAASLGALTLGACTRIPENQTALKTQFGEVVEAPTSRGFKCFIYCGPGVEFHRFPTTLQRTAVSTSESSNVTIRTSDNARIFGDVIVRFRIDETHEDFRRIYTALGGSYENDVKDFALSAVQAVYPNYSSEEVTSRALDIGEAVRERLQDIVNENDYGFFVIQNVITSGMGLSEQANRQLEDIVAEQRRGEIAGTRLRVSQVIREAEINQAGITGAAYNALSEAGVPEGQLSIAYCLQLLRDSETIGQVPLACNLGGDASVAVSTQATRSPARSGPQ